MKEKIMSKIFSWLKPSLEGNNGTASSRRITAFWFVVLATITNFSIITLAYLMVLQNAETSIIDVETLKELITLFVYVVIAILILFGIVTVQQISQLITLKKSNENATSTDESEAK